jgi:hypothetical protein
VGKIQYLQNFLYGTAKTVFRLYLLDGGDIAQGGLLLHQLRTLLDDAYHDAIKEVAAANAIHGFGSPSPKEPPEADFPPGFSNN